MKYTRRKSLRNKRTLKRRSFGAGKATLTKNEMPVNPYPKADKAKGESGLERQIFGQFVSWFYFPRGPFPNNSANADGYVPLSRFLETRTFRDLQKKYPDIDMKQKSLEVLGDAFITKNQGGEVSVKALSWPQQAIPNAAL